MNSYNILSNKKNKIKKTKYPNIQNILKNVKSKYVLNEIFSNVKANISLDIIKYNKEMKNRLNISINNYKEYSELFSSIEIEIIPVENKYGKFININNEEDESYYHFYFNDKKVEEEIKRCYINEFDKITKINIIIDYQIISLEHSFEACDCIESINFKKFYRNNINNMSYLFNGVHY